MILRENRALAPAGRLVFALPRPCAAAPCSTGRLKDPGTEGVRTTLVDECNKDDVRCLGAAVTAAAARHALLGRIQAHQGAPALAAVARHSQRLQFSAALWNLYAEGMGRTSRSRPNEIAGQPWPDVPSSDPVVEAARKFVVRLKAAVAGRSVRSVAMAAGLHHQTLLNVLNGQVWPDLATIARLEQALDVDLWPGRGDD